MEGRESEKEAQPPVAAFTKTPSQYAVQTMYAPIAGAAQAPETLNPPATANLLLSLQICPFVLFRARDTQDLRTSAFLRRQGTRSRILRDEQLLIEERYELQQRLIVSRTPRHALLADSFEDLNFAACVLHAPPLSAIFFAAAAMAS